VSYNSGALSAPSTVTCSKCRTEYPAAALFCPMCGAAKVRDFSGDPLLGTIVAGRYVIQERIGYGASGSIYQAMHTTLRRKTAVKVLHEELSRDDLAIERFRRAATTVGEIDNDHIVGIEDFGRTDDGRLYLAMELLEGETLDAVIERGGPMDFERVVSVLVQAGEALMEAHAMGYVHRDLRPRNIFLARRRGQTDYVKLLDFGLAKLVEKEGQAASTSLGMTFGDPHYMSPEQAGGDPVDRRTDIYSLGCIAYEMVTGRPPFAADKVFDVLTQHLRSEAPRPRSLRPDCPPWLDEAIACSLAKSRDDRFVTVYRFIEALTQGSESGTTMTRARAQRTETVPPESVTATLRRFGKELPPGAATLSEPVQVADPADTVKTNELGGPLPPGTPAPTPVPGSLSAPVPPPAAAPPPSGPSVTVKTPMPPSAAPPATAATSPTAISSAPPLGAAPPPAAAPPLGAAPPPAAAPTPGAAPPPAAAPTPGAAPPVTSPSAGTPGPLAATRPPGAGAGAPTAESPAGKSHRVPSSADVSSDGFTVSQAWYADGEALGAASEAAAAGDSRALREREQSSTTGLVAYEDEISGGARRRLFAAGGVIVAVALVVVAALAFGDSNAESDAAEEPAVAAAPELEPPEVAPTGEGAPTLEAPPTVEAGAAATGTTEATEPAPATPPASDAPAPARRAEVTPPAAARRGKKVARDSDQTARQPRRKTTRKRRDPRPEDVGFPPKREPKTEPKPEPKTPDPAPDKPGDAGQAEFFAKLGDKALRNGDVLGAASNFNKARDLNPKSGPAYAGLGEIALTQGHYSDAVVHLKKAARFMPRSARAQTLLGEAYLGVGKNKQAANAFRAALKINPDNAVARNGYNEAISGVED